MSVDDAVKFVEKLKTDSGLRKKTSGISDMDAVLKFAGENGYKISEEDLMSASEIIDLSVEPLEGELDDEALEKVSGGRQGFFASGEQVGGFLEF